MNDTQNETDPTFDRGPWHDMGLSGHYQGPEGEFHELMARDESRSCSVGRVYVRNSNEYARAVARANAKLIAAAPDMPAALYSAADILEKLVKINRLLANSAGLRDARAAIAKAEGR